MPSVDITIEYVGGFLPFRRWKWTFEDPIDYDSEWTGRTSSFEKAKKQAEKLAHKTLLGKRYTIYSYEDVEPDIDYSGEDVEGPLPGPDEPLYTALADAYPHINSELATEETEDLPDIDASPYWVSTHSHIENQGQ